jgi:hypothetical protein
MLSIPVHYVKNDTVSVQLTLQARDTSQLLLPIAKTLTCKPKEVWGRTTDWPYEAAESDGMRNIFGSGF